MDLPVETIKANSPILVNQTTCQRFFQFTVDKATLKRNFIILEVIFEDLPAGWSFSPIIVEKNGERPIVLMSKHIPLTQNIDTMDYNAYTARKLYHHITLNMEEVSLNDVLYFGVYFVFDAQAIDNSFSLPYTIQLRTPNAYPCPGNCTSNGICNEKLEQCLCNKGFFDEDCSVRGTRLTTLAPASLKIAANARGLFYMEMDNQTSQGMTLDFGKTDGPTKFSLSFNDPDDFSLPTGRCDADSFSFESINSQTCFTIGKDSCENRSHQILLIEPINLQNEDIIITASVELTGI